MTRPRRLLLLALATAFAMLAALAAPGASPASAETRLGSVEVGQNHACALEPNGVVTCWGEDAVGQVSDWGKWRYRSERFAQVSAGSFLTCGILADGGVMCWGYPEQEDGSNRESDNRDWEDWAANPDPAYDGWVNTPPDTVKFRPGSLSVGNFHACAIQADGELACWGKAGDSRLVIPDDDGEAISDWTLVEAGFANACAIREDGSVTCFGRTTHGRSDGPSGDGPFVDVTMGVYNGCALAADGSVECWGRPPDLAQQYNRLINTAQAGVAFTAIEMATTEHYSCGVAQAGDIYCWGVVPSNAAFARVQPPAGSFASISVGSSNSCALDSTGDLTCWGDDNSALMTPPSGEFTQVTGGADFSCALTTDGTIECWGGDNAFQQLNAPAGSFTLVSSGDTHSCAIRSDDTVACWGGVSGDPARAHASAVAPAGAFITLDAGNDLTCGIKGNDPEVGGTLQCWGDRSHDRLNEPDGSFTRVAVGATHVCAIEAVDQGVVCWGETTFFDREGDGVPDDIDGVGNHTTTTPPDGDHLYMDISAGEGHTCAIREDGRAVCWGHHADGRNQVPGSSSDPMGFSGETYIDIATGGPNNCAIREEDGSLACWNHEKQQYWPGSEVLAMTGLTSLGAGASHMCAIDGAGALVCWGVAGIIPFPSQLSVDILEARVVARRLADGRVEFGFRPEGEALILPTRRFVPADAQVDHWLTSSLVVSDGEVLGRIAGRIRADGRIEAAFDPVDAERVLPNDRFIPATAEVDRWLRSSIIEVPLPAATSSTVEPQAN